jgi:hypothetical protein
MLTGGAALAQESPGPTTTHTTEDTTFVSTCAQTGVPPQTGHTTEAEDATCKALLAKETRIFEYGFAGFVALGTVLPLGLLLLANKYGSEDGNALGLYTEPGDENEKKRKSASRANDNNTPRL